MVLLQAAGSSHTKRIYSKLHLIELEFYSQKRQIRFEPPFGGARGNVCTSSIARAVKIWRGVWLWELPKLWRLPFNISAVAAASDFNLSMLLGFAKAHRTIPPRTKRRAWCLTKICGFLFNIFAMAEVVMAVS